MVFDIKDYSIAKELIFDIGKDETILWQGKMDNESTYSKQEPKVDLFLQVTAALFLVTVLIVALKTAYVGSILSFLLFFGLIQLIRQYFYTKSKTEQERTLKFTHYVVTEERILFLLYKREKIHLHFLPLSDIEAVVPDQKKPNTGNIKFRTTVPVSFNAHFDRNRTVLQAPSETELVPRFEQIQAPQKIAAMINRYL